MRVHAREHRNQNTAATTHGANEISAVQVLPSYNQATGSQGVRESQNEGIDLPCYNDVCHVDEIADGSHSIPPSYEELNIHNNPRLLDITKNKKC